MFDDHRLSDLNDIAEVIVFHNAFPIVTQPNPSLSSKASAIGDTNLDGTFNSSDLVEVFTAGEYEDSIRANSGWKEGDWNGDQEFDSADLVAAFQAGGFVNAAQNAQEKLAVAVMGNLERGITPGNQEGDDAQERMRLAPDSPSTPYENKEEKHLATVESHSHSWRNLMETSLFSNESAQIEVTAFRNGNAGRFMVSGERVRFDPENLMTNSLPIELPISQLIRVESDCVPGVESTCGVRLITSLGSVFYFRGTWEADVHRLLINYLERGLGTSIPFIATEQLREDQIPPPESQWDVIRTFAFSYDDREGRCGFRECLMNEIVSGDRSVWEIRSALWQYVVAVESRLNSGERFGDPDYKQRAMAAIERIRQVLNESPR